LTLGQLRAQTLNESFDNVATSTNRIEPLEVSGADAAHAEHRCGNVRDGREVAPLTDDRVQSDHMVSSSAQRRRSTRCGHDGR
jgi:hypothetical protein